MNYFLLGIVTGISISILNILLIKAPITARSLSKLSNKVDKSFRGKAVIIDMDPPVDLN